jgi:hypothetical protein
LSEKYWYTLLGPKREMSVLSKSGFTAQIDILLRSLVTNNALPSSPRFRLKVTSSKSVVYEKTGEKSAQIFSGLLGKVLFKQLK